MISPIRQLSQEQRDFIVALAAKGEHTQAELARLVATTQSNISKLLARARGDPPKPRPPRKPPSLDDDPIFFAASQLGTNRRPLNLDLL
jgi:hypothetical protein